MTELRTYRRKRDFSKTAEPEGGSGRLQEAADDEATREARPPGNERPPGGMFCIQKHAASRLHFDLRLELDGVLVSWAVPKGLSLDPKARRLAVRVEDHPVEYGDFEGTIPKGEYGGGTVMLWDTGAWEPIGGDAQTALEKGELKFRLSGERLQGGWVLVHTRGAGREHEDQWLLIKERDDQARPDEPDPWGSDDRSVASGRTMAEIAAGEGPRRRAAAAEAGAPLPAAVPLTLATPAAAPPEGDEWLHEIKYDGYRIAARVDERGARLFTRNGLDWTARFAPVAAALASLKTTGAWLDGEVIALDERGVSDFGLLQRHAQERASGPEGRSGGAKGRPGTDRGAPPGDLAYVAFDLLFEDGEDLRPLPLVERKRRLVELLRRGGAALQAMVRYGDHIEGRGTAVFEEACVLGLEGVVSKRAGDAYADRRTRSWLKVKCSRRQEFVIGGFTEPSGERGGFGALLVGVYDRDEALRFAGRVGSGFGDAALARLHTQLKKLERGDAAFADPPRGAQARGVHWTEPQLVAEVAFSEWTADGRLRHPVFKGLREDKAPEDVRREDRAPGEPEAAARRAGASGRSGAAPKAGVARPARRGAGRGGGAPGARDRPLVGGVAISHPERVVFPDPGMTKRDVAEYYAAVAPLMVPYLERRPLTVIRCPDGIGSECFFQKHVTPSVPKTVSRARVRDAEGRTVVYPVVDSTESLLAMVQNGAVEFHVWGSRAGAIEVPDVIVFDLDPGPDVAWARVREAARTLREELAGRGLESYLRTSGGKGLHVVVPHSSRARWAKAGAFAREVAEALVAREPDKFTATMSKAKRGGKVFVDHFRNGRGATSVASYSLRSRPGAPVALPISWDELGRVRAGAEWTAPRVLRRLRAHAADPWADFWKTGRRQRPEADRR